jgi:DNA-binding IclR family transcriptional regulator
MRGVGAASVTACAALETSVAEQGPADNHKNGTVVLLARTLSPCDSCGMAERGGRLGTPEAATSRGGVAAVDRAVAVLHAVARADDACSLAELAAATGLYKSTILRLAASLDAGGLVVRGADGRFRLGAGAAELGARFQRSAGPEEFLLPLMRELAEESGESVAFYVPAGRQRLCLYRVESRQALRYSVREGDVLPLELGSGGRMLMAHLGAAGPLYDRIRAAGYYHSDGERDPDVAGLSAPVFRAGGEIAGALTVAGPRQRLAPDRVRSLVGPLMARAAAMTAALHGRGPSTIDRFTAQRMQAAASGARTDL